MFWKDIAYERKRTRDLLLQYDQSIMPPLPNTAGLNVIYPWENTALSVLQKQLYQIASNNGFDGDENNFIERFVDFLSSTPIITDYFEDFPVEGSLDYLYFDLGEKILFYWNGEEYLPVNATLIANSIIYGGGA